MLALFFHIIQVIGVDILLSGDNAVVIALACRNLPEAQRKKGVLFGAAGALGLRILFVTISVWLLAIPGFKIAAGLLLLWIAYGLISSGEEEDPGDGIEAPDKLWSAIRTIIVADVVMSIDNIAAVAGVAESSGPWHFPIMAIGLIVSIPLVIWGSQVIMKLMDKFPWIIPAGGILLGWVAGNMIGEDNLLSLPHSYIPAIIGAAVIAIIVLFRKVPTLTNGM